MKERENYKLGDVVIVRGKLVREETYYRVPVRNCPNQVKKKYWKRMELSKLNLLNMQYGWYGPGFYIGYRTLTDGETTYTDTGGEKWTGKKSYQVGLVVLNERENPVYVLFEDMRVGVTDYGKED